ncbi:MAG: hypothetical protein ACRESA_09950 [Gammaproteobacteria bacterium]
MDYRVLLLRRKLGEHLRPAAELAIYAKVGKGWCVRNAVLLRYRVSSSRARGADGTLRFRCFLKHFSEFDLSSQFDLARVSRGFFAEVLAPCVNLGCARRSETALSIAL